MTMLFPLTLTVLDIAAAAVYAYDGDLRRCIYWLAAATLTICVTL